MKKYIPIVDFIADLLGDKAEVVLHDLTLGLNSTVIYIRNSLSGRKVGSPATDLLVNILQNNVYKEKNYLTNYNSKAGEGKKFRSSSYFIKDENNELKGMICVNIDYTEELVMVSKLNEFLEQFSKVSDNNVHVLHESQVIEENLYGTVENIVEDTIYKVTGNVSISDIKLKKEEKLEIVRRLDSRGYFALKESIGELANIFNMSEVSIYKYIQEIKRDKKL